MAKIKSVKRFNRYFKTFNFSNTQEIAEDEHLESNTTLDESGNTLLEEKFNVDGELEERNTYTYNPEGKLMEHSLLYAVEDVTEKRILKRDEKGRLIVETKYYGNESGEHTEYVYDEKGEPVERKNYDEEGNFISVDKFSYNEKGGLSEQVKLGPDQKVEEKTVFQQPDDKTIEQLEYEGSEKLKNKTVIRFNDAGKELSSVQTTPEGKLISGVYSVYDENGNLLERQYKDFYSKTIRYQYDEQSRLIMQELFDGNGMLLRKNMYAYDDDGNMSLEQTYEMDTSRGGRDKHFETRYEYEFYS